MYCHTPEIMDWVIFKSVILALMQHGFLLASASPPISVFYGCTTSFPKSQWFYTIRYKRPGHNWEAVQTLGSRAQLEEVGHNKSIFEKYIHLTLPVYLPCFMPHLPSHHSWLSLSWAQFKSSSITYTDRKCNKCPWPILCWACDNCIQSINIWLLRNFELSSWAF